MNISSIVDNAREKINECYERNLGNIIFKKKGEQKWKRQKKS